jgi:glycosyltransferase involved in cell wall biosynthesis
MILLVLMVRNEAAILERCLDSASVADAVLIVDTGSTDNTVAVAQAWLEKEGKPGHIAHHTWRDFGWNRTRSFHEARGYAVDRLGLCPKSTFALLLDADMVLKNGQDLVLEGDAPGFSLIQRGGDTAYKNTRLLRLSHPWVCVGPTHEYWSGGYAQLINSAWIEDIGDGGCKADKFDRDARLLLKGLEDEPANERYIFYLAQTYRALGKLPEAIEQYKRRISLGGWREEVWYSHYMIAKCYEELDKIEEAELWVQRAYKLDPSRREALMLLISHFRCVSQHYKAWHYLLLAEACSPPKEALFLETDTHRLSFERSVLAYYVGKDGVDCSLRYQGPLESVVLSNLRFYAERFVGYQQQLTFPEVPGFKSSSVAVNECGQLNVRTVNYVLNRDGSYALPQGVVATRNFRSQWRPRQRQWDGWSEVTQDPGRQTNVLGLEDVRLQGNTFTATTREFSYCDRNRVALGIWPEMDFRVLRPPQGETDCEKNWLPIDSDRMIWRWHPFQILQPDGCETKVVQEHETPASFRHFRGSAPPFRVDERMLSIVHIVAPCNPRVYLHLLVEHDASMKPIATSRPFYFRELGVEYCVGARQFGDSVHIFFSCWDAESWVCIAPAALCLSMLASL